MQLFLLKLFFIVENNYFLWNIMLVCNEILNILLIFISNMVNGR